MMKLHLHRRRRQRGTVVAMARAGSYRGREADGRNRGSATGTRMMGCSEHSENEVAP
jgi:hypothetical protein